MIDGPYYYMSEETNYEVFVVDSKETIKVISSPFLEGSGQWIWQVTTGDAIVHSSDYSEQTSFRTHYLSLYYQAVLTTFRLRENGSVPRIVVYICL
tara:strand:- start:1827 stop:2114 length:288 start_codon:yes stop_codon:yes gene_type:complete